MQEASPITNSGPVLPGLRLHTFFRSGASHRVRIALALKGVGYEPVPVHLVRGGGEHRGAAFRALNPQGRVPVLALPDGTMLIQSSAIVEYLEEVVPLPRLLPADPVQRARVRGVAALIGADIHPLYTIGVLEALRGAGLDEAAVGAWITQWITAGLQAVEALIGDEGWCFGAAPGLADVYLAPQLFAADRFGVGLAPFPRIRRVAALAAGHPAFIAAAPQNQIDAE